MAITNIPALHTSDAVDISAATEFTTTGSFILYADYFRSNEKVELFRLGASGDFIPATNDKGIITLSNQPNMVRVDSIGTFRLKKTASNPNVYVGYEEV